MRKSGFLAVAAAVVAGGLAGAAFMRPALSSAGDSPRTPSSVSADARAHGEGDGHRDHHDEDHRGGPGGWHHDHDHDGDRGRPGMPPEHLAAAAKALGVSADALEQSLQSGKTIAEVAKAEGVAVGDVVKALVASEVAELDAAVADGKLTEAQADAMKAQATPRFTAIVNGERPPGGPGMGHGPGDHDRGQPGMPPEHLAAAAKALGVSADALEQSLQSGKTIAEVAKAEGVAVGDVVKALVASEVAELDAAVADGKLTEAQADAMKAQATSRFTAIVNGECPPGGPGMGHGPGGPGMDHGPGGWDHDHDGGRGPGADATSA